MFEKSNQKIGTARKDPGKSLWPQCYAIRVAGRLRDNSLNLSRLLLSRSLSRDFEI